MRILVIKLSSLGDLFHALPAVHLLKKHKDPHLTWVTQTEYVPLVRCFSDVDEIIAFKRRGGGIGDYRSFIRDVRKQPFDMVVDFQGLFKSAWMTRLAKSNQVIGRSDAREGASLWYKTKAEVLTNEVHSVDRNLAILRALNLPTEPVVFPIKLPDISFSLPQKPFIAIAPQSRHVAKDWPLDRFIELANRLLDDRFFSLVAVGSAADVAVCNQLIEGFKGEGINLAGKTTLIEMAQVLQAADLLITNDSGPMHVADALGTPLIALFGPTDPDRTGPYQQRKRVVSSSVASLPKGGYKSKDQSAMAAIPVSEVLLRANEILQHSVS